MSLGENANVKLNQHQMLIITFFFNSILTFHLLFLDCFIFHHGLINSFILNQILNKENLQIYQVATSKYLSFLLDKCQ